MTDIALFVVITTICLMMGWLIATSKMSIKERNEMLNDEEMWP